MLILGVLALSCIAVTLDLKRLDINIWIPWVLTVKLSFDRLPMNLGRYLSELTRVLRMTWQIYIEVHINIIQLNGLYRGLCVYVWVIRISSVYYAKKKMVPFSLYTVRSFDNGLSQSDFPYVTSSLIGWGRSHVTPQINRNPALSRIRHNADAWFW